MLALSLTLGSGQAKAAGEEETVNKGVLIGTTDVSGMTAQEAEDAVEKEAKKELENNVTLTVGSSKVTATADEIGVGWSNREVVSEAMGLGKSGNIVKRYKDNKDLEHKKKDLCLKIRGR